LKSTIKWIKNLKILIRNNNEINIEKQSTIKWIKNLKIFITNNNEINIEKTMYNNRSTNTIQKVLFIGREILSDFDVCFNVFKYYGKFWIVGQNNLDLKFDVEVFKLFIINNKF